MVKSHSAADVFTMLKDDYTMLKDDYTIVSEPLPMSTRRDDIYLKTYPKDIRRLTVY